MADRDRVVGNVYIVGGSMDPDYDPPSMRLGDVAPPAPPPVPAHPLRAQDVAALIAKVIG